MGAVTVEQVGVEGADSWRAEQSLTTRSDVPLEVGHAYVPIDNGKGTISNDSLLSFI